MTHAFARRLIPIAAVAGLAASLPGPGSASAMDWNRNAGYPHHVVQVHIDDRRGGDRGFRGGWNRERDDRRRAFDDRRLDRRDDVRVRPFAFYGDHGRR